MRLSIRTKQVAGVTAVVALAATALFVWYVASLTHVMLEGNRSRARLLSKAVYQRAFAVVASGADPASALSADGGVRNILETAAYSPEMVYAVIVDPEGRVLADAESTGIGRTLEATGSLDDLIEREGPWAQLRAIYPPGRQLEVREALKIDGREFASIRVGVSTGLIWVELQKLLLAPIAAAAAVVAVAVLLAILLARLVLRPIHVIRSGLARLGRGELDVSVDLPADAELRELGDSFRQVTARLVADQTELAGQRALESVVDRLEDAVALFAPDGALLFANAAMEQAMGEATIADRHGHKAPAHVAGIWREGHPYRAAIERAMAGTGSTVPTPIRIPDEGERLVLAHIVPGAAGAPLGVLLVSRNLAYLSQVESTLDYSRKLARLNGLTAGIAHEIKNPLNATMIHLELLKMQVAGRPEAEQHVAVIADQVRRLDQVLQDIMKFLRPEVLHLEPVELPDVFERLRPVLEAEAAKHKVDVRLELPADLPAVEGDPNLLEQAFLNLALNAFQAMPNGGRLRIGARASGGRLVAIDVADTGIGIAPENLPRIFDLYFTTKPSGSGIGLSMVFRTVQLHGGDIEVRSTPGHGATFRIQLKQAARVLEKVGG